MKKVIGTLAVVMIASTMFFNANANDSSLASIVATDTANSKSAAENDTDCDNDPNDVCWNQETGVKYTDCDPSSFWDTCGDPVDDEA
ncbi:hypothetical protein [Pedobacter sp. Hv1]|uniref:hypothetical protein n=1 Tax=Pedobacter sp. Hv1 TaxID=1740090 RepID=UPI0006D88EA6|nr:hypothetical protein [Pedobacter sp. Hv1]KQC02758.1 hypothetical protein AQF98_04065 [Pedobacter sp. Hv1]